MDVSNTFTHPGSIGPELASKLNSYAGAAARTRGTGTSPMVSSAGGSDPANIGAAMSALSSATPEKAPPAEVPGARDAMDNEEQYRQDQQAGQQMRDEADANMDYLKTRYGLDDNGQPKPGSSTTSSPAKMTSADIHGPQFRGAAVLGDATEAA